MPGAREHGAPRTGWHSRVPAEGGLSADGEAATLPFAWMQVKHVLCTVGAEKPGRLSTKQPTASARRGVGEVERFSFLSGVVHIFILLNLSG